MEKAFSILLPLLGGVPCVMLFVILFVGYRSPLNVSICWTIGFQIPSILNNTTLESLVFMLPPLISLA